jgi:hypothetical protein
MLRLSPLLEQERTLLPTEVAVRWGINEIGVEAPIRCDFDDDLDADGQLWMRVLIDGTGERWFAVDSRAVGVYDVGGELFVVPAMADEVA